MSHPSTAINPHAAQPTSPVALGKSFWRNRQLIMQVIARSGRPRPRLGHVAEEKQATAGIESPSGSMSVKTGQDEGGHFSFFGCCVIRALFLIVRTLLLSRCSGEPALFTLQPVNRYEVWKSRIAINGKLDPPNRIPVTQAGRFFFISRASVKHNH